MAIQPDYRQGYKVNLVIILLAVVGVLFVTSYIMKRHYGVLGLALCAGYLLATMWTDDVTLFIQGAGFDVLIPPLKSFVTAAIILVPSIPLLIRGPIYHRRWQRIVGALAFALLAASFLLASLGTWLELDGTGKQVYETLIHNKDLIITATIAYAIYDVFMLKNPKIKDKKK